MYDPSPDQLSNRAPYPLEPPESPRHSPLGIASFVASIVAMLSICAFFLFAYVAGSGSSYSATSTGLSIVAWVFICLTAIGCLAGIGLGIAGIVQKGTNKTFGIIGLVFSSLLLIGFCLFMILIFGIVAAALSAYSY
ncbi:MAG: hypothetical protein JXB85_02575 [Anaerolineales bacterium]|nr:hypothetical protein [Anaerolineales bacterium]